MMKRAAGAVVKFILGVLLCQTAPTAVLVVGWTYRLARSAVIGRWAASAGRPVARQHWPNWIIGGGQRDTGVVQAWLGSLWANLRAGLRALIGIWIVTLPGAGLLFLGWTNGWNTSFNRVYEHIGLGPQTMLIGAALLVPALLYLPMALIHQAVSEDWRGLYRLGLVARLIRQKPLASFGLAVLYGALSMPLLLLTVLPLALPNIDPALERMTAGETIEFLNLYYLAAGVAVFSLFVAARLAAARVYAAAMVAAVRRGRIGVGQLPDAVRDLLGSVTVDPPRVRPAAIRWAAAAAGAVATVTIAMLTATAWLGLVSQIVIAQFFHYRGALGWLNHPMVQLPWLRYMPDHPM